jgi:hypothetical protein
LAYYSVFSLGPIIVIAIAVAGFFFGSEAVSGQVAASIKGLIGDTGAKAVQATLADAGRPREGLSRFFAGFRRSPVCGYWRRGPAQGCFEYRLGSGRGAGAKESGVYTQLSPRRRTCFGVFASGLVVGHDCARCIDQGCYAARR